MAVRGLAGEQGEHGVVQGRVAESPARRRRAAGMVAGNGVVSDLALALGIGDSSSRTGSVPAVPGPAAGGGCAVGRLSWSQLRYLAARSVALLPGMMVATTAFTMLTAASRTSQLRGHHHRRRRADPRPVPAPPAH